MNVNFFLCCCIFFGDIVSSYLNPRILELNNRFLEVKSEGNWFVMFYAPWCAHCKRLEPIWSHVQQALLETNIRVCRMDCTQHSNACYHFNIRSYPTLMFIKGDEAEYTYNDDRQIEDIVHFALRVSKDPVRVVKEEGDIDKITTNNHISFLYIGDSEGDLWNEFNKQATNFQAHSYFFHVSSGLSKKHFRDYENPSVLVFKESTFYSFENKNWDNDLNTSLFQWINEERFPTFVKITRLNINKLMETKKNLVMAVVEESKQKAISDNMINFKYMLESVIKNNRDRFHKYFQFGWISSPDLANSIAMTKVPVPSLLVLNSTTNHHHIPDDDPLQLTPEAIIIFLDSILEESARVYGGNSYLVFLYGRYFESTIMLQEMWKGNPILTILIFGLPSIFLAFIFYATCFDHFVEPDDEYDDDSKHEKKD